MAHLTVGVALTIYVITGISGYLYARCSDPNSDIPDNLLNEFPNNSTIINLCRIALALSCLSSMPLLLRPLRDAVLKTKRILSIKYGNYIPLPDEDFSDDLEGDNSRINGGGRALLKEQSMQSDDDELDESSSPFITKLRKKILTMEERKQNQTVTVEEEREFDASIALQKAKDEYVMNGKENPILRILLTSGLQGVILIAGMTVPNVSTVWQIMGSISCIIVSMVFPSAAYLRVSSRKQVTKRYLAVIAAIIGVVFTIMCTYAVIRKLTTEGDSNDHGSAKPAQNEPDINQ